MPPLCKEEVFSHGALPRPHHGCFFLRLDIAIVIVVLVGVIIVINMILIININVSPRPTENRLVHLPSSQPAPQSLSMMTMIWQGIFSNCEYWVQWYKT